MFMSDHKEFRSQVIKDLNPSNKYKKKWLHNTLKQLGIDATIFSIYGLNSDLYNVITSYLIEFPKITRTGTGASFVCLYCDKARNDTTICSFGHRLTYWCTICNMCALKSVGSKCCGWIGSIDRDQLIKVNTHNVFLWLGLLNFSHFERFNG
jgi:hypothetical protein